MTLRSACLGSLLAVLLAAPSGATQRILDDANDFTANGSGGVGIGYTVGQANVQVGDTSDDQGFRFLVRFPLADVPDPAPPTRLELTLLQTFIEQQPENENIADFTAPFMNPGLGDLLAEAVDDYGNPFYDDYELPGVAPPIVLVPAGADAPQTLTADVTTVIQSLHHDLGSPTATFRIESAVETNGDGKRDMWTIAASEVGPDQSPALVVSEPDAELCGSAAFALCAVMRRRR
jgi:hypothetical protein